MTTSQKLRDLITHLREAATAGALLAPKSEWEIALKTIAEAGYTPVAEYTKAIDALREGKSVAIVVEQDLSSDLYDIVRQYSHRRGLVQVKPKITAAPPLLQLNTNETKLLLLIPTEHEQRNRERYPDLLDMVGCVEHA
ncbi:MAG: hypothetical protein ACK5Y6_05490 [Pseudomonadota bacterium]|jgi:hypothetical protein